MKSARYLITCSLFLCIAFIQGHNRSSKEEQIVQLRSLTELVKEGKNIDEALNVVQGLLVETDPDIKKYVHELNSAIAHWCIGIIESLKKDL